MAYIVDVLLRKHGCIIRSAILYVSNWKASFVNNNG